jgi:signal transduction histidine kinase/CheY-like chemotaxis protein
VLFTSISVFFAILTSHGRIRLAMLLFVPVVALQSAAALRPAWPYRLRASVVVASFVASSFVVYAVVGFHGSGQLVAAVAIITAVLLFGRRQAMLVLGVILAGFAASGVGMVTGRLPLPVASSTSLTDAGAWIRTTAVALFLLLLVGFAVAYAVEHIESAERALREALTVLRDEKERREEADQQRMQAERVAQEAQKLEIVGRLAAGVAHDFNNVLAVVQGWTELGSKPGADDSQRTEGRTAVLAACRQGAALARQLLTISRRSTRSILTLELDEAVDSAMLVLRSILPEDIEVSTEHRGPAMVRVDEMDLQQVTLNFVVNARDAMPRGGRLRITTGVRDVTADEALVGGHLTVGRWAFLAVEDSGPGIAPAIRERIFEPFFSTKPREHGTGLGLATVLHIARESGGVVGLDSEPGCGARFALYLPEASDDRIAVSDPASTRRLVPSRSGRILVVEDNVAVRQVIQSVLERAGHRVLWAANGDRALHVLEAARDLDLLCTDGILPGAPASTVISAFERSCPGRPVLVVSGYVSDELAVRGIEQGRHRLLRKPFSPGDLSAAVADLLERSGGSRLSRDRRVTPFEQTSALLPQARRLSSTAGRARQR